MAKDRWQPLQRANRFVEHPTPEAAIKIAMARTGADRETVLAMMRREAEECEYWVNDLYQVALRKLPKGTMHPDLDMAHLNIRRRDGKPIFRDWRHFQRIKNQLVGAECEAIEIYPAESRLNDTSNKYHLWCFTDPAYRVPFGLWQRDVSDDDGDRRGGYRQRRLELAAETHPAKPENSR